METPIFDGVLGDRLAAAREAVERAGRGAARFRAALDAGQAQAVEQLAQQRAESLVAERTAGLDARVTELERLLRQATADRTAALDELAREREARAAQAAATVEQPAVEQPVEVEPVEEPVEVEPVEEPVEVEPVEVEAAPVQDRPALDRPALRRPAARTGRKAADLGPTGEDVPVVPSMKDILGSTRAAGWLDSLLGAKR